MKSNNFLFLHSYTETPNPAQFEKHCHGLVELLYVLSGEGDYIIEGKRFPMKQNSLGMFRINEYHYVCPSETCPYERFIINFDPSLAFGSAQKIPFYFCNDDSNLLFFAEEIDPAVRDAFFKLEKSEKRFDCGEIDETARDTMRSALLTEILLLVFSGGRSRAEPQKQGLSASVISYLNDHLSEPITLDRLSHRFFVSKSYLCREFRQSTGLSVVSYLNTKRILSARQMILSGMPISTAAMKVGFGDYSNFYRAFCKIVGNSPQEDAPTHRAI